MKSVSVFLLFKLGVKVFRSRLMTLVLAAILSFAGVSVQAAERVEVGSYAELEAALTNPDNAGQTIYLTADIATGGKTVAADAIADGVKVDGQGQFAIKGDGNGRFFLKGKQLQNLTIENFESAADVAEGEDVGDINNVTFKGNKGKEMTVDGYSRTYGGAISNSGTIGDIINTSFINNIASNGSGGAIYNNSGSTIGKIENSTFEGNTAYYNGGAISNSGTIDSVINTSFTNNRGGAIYNDNNGTIGTIKDSTFEGNTGGAIYNDKGTIGDIINTSFTNNRGGAIYNYGGTIGDIINISFINNTADYGNGGAIYNHGTIGDIIDTSFINNTASNGGAIYNYGTISNIINTSFTNNTSNNSSFGGGAIGNSYGTIEKIKDSTFEGNTAQGNGGAIHNWVDGRIGDIINTSFTNNTAGSNGGAIWSQNTIKTIKDSTFEGNTAQGNGGAFHNQWWLEKIENSTFEGNTAGSNGGAIHHYNGTIGAIINTSFTNNSSGYGGVIYNSSTIKTIKDSIFEGNTAKSNGGAIYNEYKIGDIINTSFTNNTAKNGGAIYSNKDLQISAQGDGKESVFSGNKMVERDEQGEITSETSNAIFMAGGNLTLSATEGGKVKFDDGILFSATDGSSSDLYITGDESGKVEFNNTIKGFSAVDISGATTDFNNGVETVENVRIATGAANVNTGATLKNIEVNTDGRLAVNDGGSVYQTAVNDGGKMSAAAGGYAENTTINSGGALDAAAKALLHNLLANGGAVLDIDNGAVLTGNIILDAGAELGGSYDYNKIFKDEVADEGSLTLVGGLNSLLQANSLVNTTADKRLNLSGGDYAIGDGAQAVAGWDKLTVKDNAVVKLEGNIWMSGADKNINLMNGTELNLAGHSPGDYQIVGSLNNDGHVNFSHAGDGADDVTTVFGNYKAFANAEMTIDVDPVANKADQLIVQGDVAGTTKVVINPLSPDEATDKILFVSAPNDLADTAAHFDIYRVIGDAHVWNVLYADNNWYTGTDNIIPDSDNNGYGDNTAPAEDLDDETQNDAVLPPDMPDIPERPKDENNDGAGDNGNNGNNGGAGDNGGNGGTSVSTGGKTKVYGEAVAYAGLPAMGMEQTRDMVRHIAANVKNAKEYNVPCSGYYSCYYDRQPQASVWVSPVYARAEVDAPVGFDAQVGGLEGGFDVQKDAYNRFGMFLSYRHGKYDLDGSGKDLYSDVGSDVEINSYVAGLYHRYDHGRVWTMASLYGGRQNVEVTTDDGVKADTDGFMFGGSIEGGVAFAPKRDLIIEPTMRLAYTQINYDDMHDRYGKTAEYDALRNIEAEIGVKIEKSLKKTFGIEDSRIYVKPSVIQNFGRGDVAISSLSKVSGLDDMTLGRLEVGGNVNFTETWSAFFAAVYTFGADYANTAFNLGVRYEF